MKEKQIVQVDSMELGYYVLSKVSPVNHLKLQKLMYYIQAWHLAIFERPVIEDEFEAWLHGPVLRKLWDHFKHESYMYDLIAEPSDEGKKEHIEKIEKQLSDDQKELMEDVLSEYNEYNAYHLECLTHDEGPWKEARKGSDQTQRTRMIIDKQSMKEFYQAQYDKKEPRKEPKKK